MNLQILIVCIVTFVQKVSSLGVAIILERFDTLHLDPNFATFDATVFKYNHTTYAFNANSTLLKEISIDHDVSLSAQAYAEFSNEYRSVPLSIQSTICKAFNNKYEYKMLEDELNKDGHVPHECPVKTGNYYVKNVVPDASKLPPSLPWEKMMLYINATDETGTLVGSFKIYFRLDHSVKFMKKIG